MEKSRNIIIISSYIFLMLIFFMLGYFIGKINHTTNTAAIPTATTTPVSAPALIPDLDLYCVKIKDSSLILYKVSPNEEEILYKLEISEGIFPPEDIEDMKRGITFSNISEAQSFIEDFSS